MYYFLRQDLFEAEGIIEVAGHADETAQFDWELGVRFDRPVSPCTIALDPEYGERMADYFETVLPLMSDQLLQALRDCGVDNLDCYPVVLKRLDNGKEWREYKAVNVVGTLDAIDLEKSEYVRSPLGLPDFKSIVVDPSRVSSSLCFRLDNGPALIVVHKRVAQAIAKRGFVAVMVQKTEDYAGS